MRQDTKKHGEERRINVFRRNRSFPAQFGKDEETPEAQETLEFWQSINNKEVTKGWRDDEPIQEALREMRATLRGQRCRWYKFTEVEFEDVLRCTAPWKACGVDSVYSFPIKKCSPIKKSVFELVKKKVEWKVADRWNEENDWILEGRTVLVYKGGDRKEPGKIPLHHLPPHHHKDGDACHPQEDEKMAVL